jgi:putative nucleotidyltransferase with HDIG domain
MAKNEKTLRLNKASDTKHSGSEGFGQRHKHWKTAVVTAVWYVLVVLTTCYFLYDLPYPTEEGSVSRQTVMAETELEITDVEATREKRRKLQEKRPEIWILDDQVETDAHSRVNVFIDLLKETKPGDIDELEKFRTQLGEQNDILISAESASQFMARRLAALKYPLTWSILQRDLNILVHELLSEYAIINDKTLYQSHFGNGTLEIFNMTSIREPLLPPRRVLEWRSSVRDHLLTVSLPALYPDKSYDALRLACSELVVNVVSANLNYDRAKTTERFIMMERGLESNPVTKSYGPGETIVKKGESLTLLQAHALADLNSRRIDKMTMKLIGILLITSIIFTAVGLYLVMFSSQAELNTTTITLHALPPFLALVIGHAWDVVGDPWTTLLFPSAMIGTLTALLIRPQVAFILVLVTSCLFGITMEQDLDFLVIALASGFCSVLASRQIRARIHWLRAGLKVGIVNMVTLGMLMLIRAQVPEIWHIEILIVFLNGLLYPFVSIILLTVFEKGFGVVTDLSLIELTGDKNDLLAQLEEAAPGTYQHVLNVAKLAEAAAQEIGANYLLVRAGAMFHDIGKMIKPKYYTENQVSLEDKKVHSRITPYMSVLIIRNHVKEGLDIGRKWKLPKKVLDFIPEHHGTSLISYFFEQAMRRYEESEAVDPVREQDFRYPGPRPQSIESAIVLIADSVEAICASRFTGGQVSVDELRRTVQEAITTRFNDGQFDICNLTMHDLFRIRESLVRTLKARYHFRITYPEQQKRTQPQPKDREITKTSIAVVGPGNAA